jgi:DNA-binding protein H-NS
MKSLKDLDANELSKIIVETQAELQRRINVDKASAAVQEVLKKYDVSIEELEFKAGNKKRTRKNNNLKTISRSKAKSKKMTPSASKKKNDQRAIVLAKFHSPTTNEKWSGRGRTPAWVNRICSAEGIDVKQFKSDPRFQS